MREKNVYPTCSTSLNLDNMAVLLLVKLYAVFEYMRPAQLTTTFSCPWSRSISWMTPLISFESVTLAGTKVTFSPRSLHTWAPFDVARSQNTTFEPNLLRRSTVARPSPDAPPVTSATRFYDNFIWKWVTVEEIFSAEKQEFLLTLNILLISLYPVWSECVLC